MAPAHVPVWDPDNNGTFWYVPLVYDAPAVTVPATICANLCALSNVIVAREVVVVTPLILWPIPSSVIKVSAFSLVILFLRSSVTTSPIGLLNANDFAEFGLSS